MRDYGPYIASVFHDGAELRRAMTAAPMTAMIAEAADRVTASLRGGGKVLVFGNGGSAADAQHIAAELVGRLTVDRSPLAAIALTVDSSALTAIANDFGFAQVYERQLRALGRAGDVAIAISTSGKSESILRATAAAREMGIVTIGLTGAKGVDFAASCDVGVVVPSFDTARIQECHITVGHLLCGIAEMELCDIALPAVRQRAAKHVTLEEMVAIRERLRAERRTVVWTNGCFDILHAGHAESLRMARALGDVLVVGINDDDHVRRTKGEDRPIHALEQRVGLLSALEMVDYVLPFSEPTPVEVLGQVRPDVHCKGMDYAPPHGAPIPEAEVVRGYGGRIEFLPLVPGLSTSSIARRISSQG